MAIHSSIPAWRIPWIKDSCRLQSMESQVVEHDLTTKPPPPALLSNLLKRISDIFNALEHKHTTLPRPWLSVQICPLHCYSDFYSSTLCHAYSWWLDLVIWFINNKPYKAYKIASSLNNPWSFPDGSVSKESTCDAGDTGVPGLIPGLRRSPGEWSGNPLKYSCLEDPMDRGAWQATVHGVTKSQTRLSD